MPGSCTAHGIFSKETRNYISADYRFQFSSVTQSCLTFCGKQCQTSKLVQNTFPGIQERKTQQTECFNNFPLLYSDNENIILKKKKHGMFK